MHKLKEKNCDNDLAKNFNKEVNSFIKRPSVNDLVENPHLDGSKLWAQSEWTDESIDNSLSVDTSDLDEIEAEYYFDKAVDQKVNFRYLYIYRWMTWINNFEHRVQTMTKVMIDRVEEPSSSSDDDIKNGQCKALKYNFSSFN